MKRISIEHTPWEHAWASPTIRLNRPKVESCRFYIEIRLLELVFSKEMIFTSMYRALHATIPDRTIGEELEKLNKRIKYTIFTSNHTLKYTSPL